MIGLRNNEQVDQREMCVLFNMVDAALTVVQLHAIEPGYCIDAPDCLPLGACHGFTPRTKAGQPMKHPSRNLTAAMWGRRR